jgi:hypothetical protein
MQITLTLLILLVAIILFATEWIRMDLNQPHGSSGRGSDRPGHP